MHLLKRFYRYVHNFFKSTPIIKHYVQEQDAEAIKRYLDDEDNRIYEKPGQEGVYSVTTILGKKNDDGKENALKYWRKNNNGQGDNADWEDLLHYKTNRGTLAHYAAFNRFDHAFQHGDSMWTEDEAESQAEIDGKHGDQDYLYSVMNDKDWINSREAYNDYLTREDTTIQDVLTQDLNYVQEEFDRICREKNIKASNVVEVEAMFARPPGEEHNGFGGQADLMYVDDETGEHVVADLKTSKRIYDKHKYQAAAYAQAAKEDPELNGDYVDRCEIIRICPDTKESEVYVIEDYKDLWEEFASLTYKAAE